MLNREATTGALLLKKLNKNRVKISMPTRLVLVCRRCNLKRRPEYEASTKTSLEVSASAAQPTSVLIVDILLSESGLSFFHLFIDILRPAAGLASSSARAVPVMDRRSSITTNPLAIWFISSLPG